MNEMEEIKLEFVPDGSTALSRTQKLFNTLTARIRDLEGTIVQEDERLSNLLQAYGGVVPPIYTKIGQAQLLLAVTLGKAADELKFTKSQTDYIRETILILCEHAFYSVEPTEEQIVFFDRWSEVSYSDKIAQQESETSEEEEESDENASVVDTDDFDDSPDAFERFQERVRSNAERARQEQHTSSYQATKRQLAAKAKEGVKNKSIRSVYITLAKVLHPDMETDLALKAEKEEVMKSVTVAYDQKDLATLLQLEMEWVHKTVTHLHQLADDKLKVYISALKQQVVALERELQNLYAQPRYAAIQGYAFVGKNYAPSMIKRDAKLLKNNLKELKMLVGVFQNSSDNKQIADFTRSYFEYHGGK